MNQIIKLINYFKNPTKDTKGTAPDGYCPNCWGRQLYDQKVRKLYVDKQIDVNNHQANYTFIQKFVVEQLVGIQLRNRDRSLQCPTCNKIFPKED